MPTYDRGEIVMILKTKLTEPGEAVVLDDLGNILRLLDGTEVVKACVLPTNRRLDVDALFARRQALLLEKLPEEFRGFVSSTLWERGHAYGLDEVILHAEQLVETLLDPIRTYTARIKEEAACPSTSAAPTTSKA